jgi:signal transduction histidine kinase
VPIVAAGRWLGVIIAEPEKGAAPLDNSRRDLLWILGKTLALASTSRIATTVGARARELEERIDFARGIHEGVVQRLFGVSLVLSSEQPLTAEARARCAREVGAALGELRSALQRPLGRSSAATGTTLRAELDRLCREHADLGLTIEGPIVDVPEALEPLAQSVLTEAVRNARKHSDARRIVVRTHTREDTLVVEIENDGVPLERTASTGVGLRLAALEALQSGGLVEFGERRPGTWVVRLVVPLPAGDGAT